MQNVYFNDRSVTFSEGFGEAFRRDNGLYYRVDRLEILEHLVEGFFRWEHIPFFHLFSSGTGELREAFAGCFTFIRAGGGLVFNQENEFLVIMRNGKWDLPKGKNEPGENFERAAGREVEEETGLAGLELGAPVISTYHTYILKERRILKQTMWFEFLYRAGEDPVLQSEEGITGYRWVQPGETGFLRENTYKSILEVLGHRRLL